MNYNTEAIYGSDLVELHVQEKKRSVERFRRQNENQITRKHNTF